jgi:hypothetical protein
VHGSAIMTTPLLNFGAITMTAGIHRVANDFPDDE